MHAEYAHRPMLALSDFCGYLLRGPSAYLQLAQT